MPVQRKVLSSNDFPGLEALAERRLDLKSAQLPDLFPEPLWDKLSAKSERGKS
jgi:hypothetical protein